MGTLAADDAETAERWRREQSDTAATRLVASVIVM